MNETWEERITREKQERETKEAAFIAKMDKAYSLLGLEVFDTEGKEYNDIRKASIKGSSQNAYLSASFNRYGYKGRICVGLWYANQLTARDIWGWDAKHEEITVSESKTSEQIAADIKRRILPKLAESIQKADALIASRKAYQDKTEENVIALGGKPRDNNGNVDRTVNIHGGSLEVSGDSVRFNLYSIDIQTAKKIVALLKKEVSI